MWSRMKSAASAVWSGGKKVVKYTIASSVATARFVSGAGQAIFNQDRFDNYSHLNHSAFSHILKATGIVGSLVVAGFTRVPNIFTRFLPEDFNTNNAQAAQEDDSSNQDNISLTDKIIKKLSDFKEIVWPSDLKGLSRLIYFILTPVNIVSVFFQSIGVIGFTKSFIQYLVPLIGMALAKLTQNTDYTPPNPEQIDENYEVALLCLYFFVFNGISNLSFDLSNAISNAHKTALDIQDEHFSWKEVFSKKTTYAAIFATLASTIPVPLLAQISTYNNLGKIPFLKISDNVRFALSIVSSFSSVIGHLMTKIPSLNRTLTAGLPTYDAASINMALRGKQIVFYPGLVFDTVATITANYTSVTDKFTPVFQNIFNDDTITDKQAGVIAFAATCSTLTGIINGTYANEAFLHNSGAKYASSTAEISDAIADAIEQGTLNPSIQEAESTLPARTPTPPRRSEIASKSAPATERTGLLHNNGLFPSPKKPPLSSSHTNTPPNIEFELP